MENNINVSALAQNIAEQCQQFEQSQEYKDMIAAAVKKLYTSAIDDVFRWGDFPKKVKEALQEAMPNNVANFVDLAKYNTLVVGQLQQAWNESTIANQLVDEVQKTTRDIISNMEVPKYVLMSEILQEFIDYHADDAAQENWDRPHILLKEDERTTFPGGYLELAFEEEPQEGRPYKNYGFEFSNCLNLSPVYSDYKKKEPLLHEGHNCYSLYAGKLRDHILGKEIFKAYSRYEQLITALYFGGAYLVWDNIDVDDYTYPHYE